jgi:hypothetical protein
MGVQISICGAKPYPRVSKFPDIKIEPGPLPEGLPEILSAGQCTPERIKADEKLLADFAQVTAWQRENGGIVLVGPTPLKFRPSDH